jgi:hypothetical protein
MALFRMPPVCLLALLLPYGHAEAASIIVYLSPPRDMATRISGVTTTNFNSSSLLDSTATSYSSPIGTYSVASGSRIPVIEDDQYGGANRSNYMYVGRRRTGDATSMTLTLLNQVTYFGFWWSAGDATNRITFYLQNSVIAQFQTSDITNLLANNPLTALNGTTTYQSSAYYGNPNNGQFAGQAANEPFSYVNIVANGTRFDKLVLDNNGTSGFETDNHSVRTGTVNIPRDFPTFVEVVEVDAPEPAPEPGYAAPLGLLAVGLAVRRLRRLRSQR